MNGTLLNLSFKIQKIPYFHLKITTLYTFWSFPKAEPAPNLGSSVVACVAKFF
jgi:hypothetical protein